jgi:N-acetylmuramoyl-L-alanine amidase
MALSIVNHRFAGAPYVPSPNSGGALRPKFVVIHYTAGGPGFDTATYFATLAAKTSAHLVIRRDGTLVQCVPFNMRAWHAGRSRWTDTEGRAYENLNHHSIGIEIENWGALRRSREGWLSWSGEPVGGAIVEACHRYGTPDGAWEVFTGAQVAAAAEVARSICAAYGIAEILGHDDISPGRKSDPGPAWDMAAFRAGVFAPGKSLAEADALT